MQIVLKYNQYFRTSTKPISAITEYECNPWLYEWKKICINYLFIWVYHKTITQKADTNSTRFKYNLYFPTTKNPKSAITTEYEYSTCLYE